VKSDRRSDNDATATPRDRLAARRWAASVCVASAAAYGLPSIPIFVFVLQEGRLPWLWDLFPMYGGPWWDSMSAPGFGASLGAFFVVNCVVAAGGILPLVALLRIALVATAWHGLRTRHGST
jgi:hypothetical protein